MTIQQSESAQSTESTQSVISSAISCDGLSGNDLAACLSLKAAVENNSIDLSTVSGQRTAFEYHRVAFLAHQQQSLNS